MKKRILECLTIKITPTDFSPADHTEIEVAVWCNGTTHVSRTVVPDDAFTSFYEQIFKRAMIKIREAIEERADE